jgi:precorrin-8X/cobalt-precorrin-8 methylmutase
MEGFAHRKLRFRRALTTSSIELESFIRIQKEVSFARLSRQAAEIAARIIHATGDTELIDDLIINEDAIERIIWGLNHQVPIIVDVRMVAAGLTKLSPLIAIDAAQAPVLSSETRSYNGMLALLKATTGHTPIVVIGSAPTALRAVLEYTSEQSPLAIIGMPVGFVDALESKQALARSGLTHITNSSRRGGSPMAAATLNALVLLSKGEYRLDK